MTKYIDSVRAALEEMAQIEEKKKMKKIPENDYENDEEDNDDDDDEEENGDKKKNGKKDMDEAMDPVNPNAVKKDFDDRKDKDIDNDGDVDDSDEYLHKRRKAISKDVKEEVSLAQLAAQHITDMWKESAYGAKKKVDKKEEMDDNEDEGDGKTMTGKPMSKIEVNPKDKEKK